MRVGFSEPKILDFDIEARPLGWYGPDLVHKEVTAIGVAWIVDGEPVDLDVAFLMKRHQNPITMLRWFRKLYDSADMVVGHYIRGFDLPTLNGAMYEFGLGPLSPKTAHDTKLDEIKIQGLSGSQENRGSMLEIAAPKVKMTMADWRSANRLSLEGLMKTRERVAGDVVQNIYMREEQMRRGFLGAPKVWDPGSSGPSRGYTP
jgi:hypothetical protein